MIIINQIREQSIISALKLNRLDNNYAFLFASVAGNIAVFVKCHLSPLSLINSVINILWNRYES